MKELMKGIRWCSRPHRWAEREGAGSQDHNTGVGCQCGRGLLTPRSSMSVGWLYKSSRGIGMTQDERHQITPA